MREIIKQISNLFLAEAKSSPQLLADMAAMEKYMAESYGERIFIELLQNADDAKSKRITLYCKNGHVFVANDGKSFNEEDIESISRSGASSKKRGESIGYRGVGFKSTSYLTNEILIHSNNVGFTFSKKLCAELLMISDIDKVPTVRIPLLIEDLDDSIHHEVQKLYQNGYQTIFVFKNAKLDLLEDELAAVNDGYFLFLNNIQEIELNVPSIQRKFRINRISQQVHIQETGKEKKAWFIVDCKTNQSIQLAFKMNNDGQIIPCDQNEAVFHCYLPTLEPTGYGFKINCDFSTDPSRKHLSWDTKTEEGLQNSANLLFETMAEIVKANNPDLLAVFSLIDKRKSFSKFANYLTEAFTTFVKKEKWIPLYNGDFITATQYQRKPRFLDNAEFKWIRQHSSLKQVTPIVSLQQGNDLDNFIEPFAKESIEIDKWIDILSEERFVKQTDPSLIGKLYGQLLKSLRSKMLINNETHSLSHCFIKTEDQQLLYWGSNKEINYPKGFLSEFLNQLTANEITWIDDNYKTNFKETKGSSIQILAKSNSSVINSQMSSLFSQKKKIHKWRAAEQQCIEFEHMQGNKAKDVSKQNLGYDVQSQGKDGTMRYIEVKSISNRNAEISLTNNEYTAAHQHGDDYYLCIIYQQEDKLILEYIQNPLEQLQLEKRVRQWEWICDDYKGEKFEVQID